MADINHLFPNAEQFDTMNALLAILASKSGEVGFDSWHAIQQAVRVGGGPSLFPIGTQLKCKKEGVGEIVWDVVAHDYNVDHIGRYKHSMTLLTHDCVVNSLQYDNTEALYYCETPLVAGTYHFTLLDGYDTATGGGKTYQFTLTKPVPANGVLTFPWAKDKQASETKVSTYNSVTEATAIETVSVTEGSGGTDLGTADGKTANMNHTHRIRYGSNNWKESAMRQFLNSAAPAGQVWKPQTKFDRPPSWEKTQAGWMNGLDPEFLEVVGTAKITNRTNGLYEEDGNIKQNYYTEDKFWIASRSEVYGGSESGLSDGTQFPYYAEPMNAGKIKYNTSGAVRDWWLRSPLPSGTSIVRRVVIDGSLSSHDATYGHGVAVACAIF